MATKNLTMFGNDSQIIPITAGQRISFGFDVVGVTFTRSDSSLILTSGSGAKITLVDFFVPDAQGDLPKLELAEGVIVNSDVFLLALDPEFDISASGGPASQQSGGVGSYEESAGLIFDGVDRLQAIDGHLLYGNSVGLDVLLADAANTMLAPDGTGDGGTGDGGTGGGGTPDPTFHVRAALLGADGTGQPLVAVSVLDANGNILPGPFPQNVIILGGTNYTVRYNSATGQFIISLLDPAAGAVGPENITIVVGNYAYDMQIGSSSTNDLVDVAWLSPDESLPFTEKTWAGSNDNALGGDSAFVSGHTSGATIGTPEGYANTELHLQVHESSLTARSDTGSAEKYSSSVELNLDNGSFYIHNTGEALFEASHEGFFSQSFPYWLDASRTEYDASVVSTMAAKGQDALNTITVNGGSATISAGGGVPDTDDADATYVSAIYATEGGKNVVTASEVTINVASQGFAPGSDAHAVVTGIRGDGVIFTASNTIEDYSETIVTSAGSVTINARITGNTDAQDQSRISYAGVAATEGGRVQITAEEDILVHVDNQTTGGAFATSGIYGLFSGSGLGAYDLFSPEDFTDGKGWFMAQEYSTYIKAMKDKDGEDSGVYLDAEGGVNVILDLGSQTFGGRVAGVGASLGTVSVTSGAGINIEVNHEGIHSAGQGNLSAVDFMNGTVNLHAQGDLVLSVSGNGEDISVVHNSAVMEVSSSEIDPILSFSGTNVILKGEVGTNTASADNNITGIDNTETCGDSLRGQFLHVEATEKFTIDVTAQHNGGTSYSTGIATSASLLQKPGSILSGLVVSVDGPEFEVNATVQGNVNRGMSKATGILAENSLIIGSLPEGLSLGRGYLNNMDSLDINVHGARYNTGIDVAAFGREDSPFVFVPVKIAAQTLDVSVSGGATTGDSANYGLRVAAATNAASADMKLFASTVNIDVDNTQRSVGISASGSTNPYGNGDLEITAADPVTWGEYAPLTVNISCTITNAAGQFKGIALEALSGGRIVLNGTNLADTITLKGDVLAYDGGHMAFSLRNGHDRVEITGDMLVKGAYSSQAANIIWEMGGAGEEDSKIFILNGNAAVTDTGLINARFGEGDDQVLFNGKIRAVGGEARQEWDLGNGDNSFSLLGGDILATQGGFINIVSGVGNDTFSLNGAIGGNVIIAAGAGNDTLILNAPDVETFNNWYQGWMEDKLGDIDCETITVKIDGGPGNGLEWLSNLVTQLNTSGMDITLDIVPSGAAFSPHMVEAAAFAADAEIFSHTSSQEEEISLYELGALLFEGSENDLLDEALDRVLADTSLENAVTSSEDAVSDAEIIFSSEDAQQLDLEASCWTNADETMGTSGSECVYYNNDNDSEQLYMQLMNTTA